MILTRVSQTNGSVTGYKESKGRNHYVLRLPAWKEDADHIMEWLEKHEVRTPAKASAGTNSLLRCV
ncbi:hypothetical protein [Chitinophaga sp. XS-30]|uniref:hypothetical protein n=1 Tax=Chitinophaga sp. XS-30 TaxID=2604421 RepID=UPI0011DD4C7F|nr:hypothetical protein [Chitinophaga sp. XS-30]QEH39690.1 hypothetical protein FW415_01950 [Chitinophaga sp. XS-30]